MTRFDCKEGWARYPQKAPISQKEEEEYEARGRRKRRESEGERRSRGDISNRGDEDRMRNKRRN